MHYEVSLHVGLLLSLKSVPLKITPIYFMAASSPNE